MSTLKEKAVSGISWSFIDSFSNQGLQFIVGIVLARLLTPAEFGLIGMITVFISVSASFIDSGFSQSLIRKKECSQTDFSTAFYFNVSVGLFVYAVLFVASPSIAAFFKEPELINILRVLGIVLIVRSLSVIQQTILTKNMNFKLQTKISIISSVLSGSIAIYMAYLGYGVWSLVAKMILVYLITTILLWSWNKWKPTFSFCWLSLKEMYNFGYKLLLSGLVNVVYQNIYYVIIGKFYSASSLGYYTRGKMFTDLPIGYLTTVFQRVSYPVFSEIQTDAEQLKAGYRKLVMVLTFIAFSSMFLMSAISKPLIIVLIGPIWLPAVDYLQLLCLSSVIFPLLATCNNVFKVKNRTDIVLKLQIINKLVAVPVVVIAIYFGIKAMLVALIAASIINYIIYAWHTSKLIDYTIKEQVKDFLPGMLVAATSAAIAFAGSELLPFSPTLTLLAAAIIGFATLLFLSEIFRIKAYIELKNISLSLYKKLIKRPKQTT